MPLEDIIKIIKEETKKEKNEIEKEKEKKLELLSNEYKGKIKEKSDEIIEKVKETKEKELAEELCRNREDRKIALLKRKREIIEKVYKKAFKEIKNFSDKDYEKILERLLSEIKKEISGECKIKITSSCEKKEILQKLLEKDEIFDIDNECIDSKGGFIAKVNDIDIDCRFETIFEKVKEGTEIKVANLLFEKD